MDKRPIISIKIKIILLMTISLLCAVTFYTYFAINLFTEDKKAYIFENVLSSSQTLVNEINSNLNLLQQEVEILNKLIDIDRTNKAQEIIGKSKIIKNIFISKKQSFLFPSENIPELFDRDNVETFKRTGDFLIYKKENFFIIDISFFQKIIDQNRVYSSVIFNNNDNNLSDNLFNQRGFSEDIRTKLIELTKKSSAQSSVKILDILENKYIHSNINSTQYDLRIVSIIDYNKAFFITQYLIKKSILFGIFILLFISAIAILFSKSISNPIQMLFIASKKIASGDFDASVNIKSNDEIGHLGNAFNIMGSEIKRYMIEMQEKLRLENEIKVAKMVQDNFFPAQDIDHDHFSIAAFNEASSECGGDWWGYFNFKDSDGEKLLFIIADATGHGVPAALLTSSINTAFNAAKNLISNGILKPEANEIMGFLNKTLAQTKTEILLTSFIGIINFQNKTINYCNSSHLDPYIIPQKNEALEKSDILPLIEAKGARLGQNIEFNYTAHTHQLQSGDIILMQTDGLVECKNEEGQEFGMRRLVKSILIKSETVEIFRNNIITSFKDFCNKINYEDDITLVCVKIK